MRLDLFPPSPATALLATCAPSLLAYNVSPSPTFFNQALAFALWGWFVIAAAPWHARAGSLRAAAPLTVSLALMGLSVLWSWGPGGLPSSLAASSLAMLAGTAVLVVAGAGAGRGRQAVLLFGLFCAGWTVAGVLNSVIAIVQVFWPGLPDGDWVARSGVVGRAVGNMRQPNHLSSLLMWSCVGVLALVELGWLARRWGAALLALFVFAVVLTASRTGLVSVLLLALWGAADRRLSPRSRLLLLAAPLLYALAWWGMTAWAAAGAQRFGGTERLAETDLSSSRFGIWANTWALIRQNPWTGVGFGEFNFAWSLTPFPGRPVAFFDHAHNLPLHLAAEMGLPAAGAVMVLLLWALWRMARSAWAGGPRHGAAPGDEARGITLRCALMMALMIGLHSLLEYPLWYAYFLLPAAWVFGHALGVASRRDGDFSVEQTDAAHPRLHAPGSMSVALAGALLMLGSVLSVLDYRRVAVIFTADEGAPPLEQRIAAGQRSLLFAHHADYAAATTAGLADHGLAPFSRASHYLLDTRLTMAWAQALADAGHVDEARHLAQRLREFRNPLSQGFFAPCAEVPPADVFQCQLPSRDVHWREFMDLAAPTLPAAAR